MAVTQRTSRSKALSHNYNVDSGLDANQPNLEDETRNNSSDNSKETVVVASVKSNTLVEKPHENVSYGDKKILTWEEVPEWMQDNHWIRGGYRVPMYNYWKCLKTLFYLHNEWVNTWSHLIGAIIFGLLFITTYHTILRPFANSIVWRDFAVLYCFLTGAIVCLSFSALFHCFTCHSAQVAASWNRCDYVGIVSLIVGSFYPSIYYGFYCKPSLQIAYIAGITTLGALTTAVAVMRHFRTPEYRWIRTILFLSLGLSAIIPVAHGIIIYGLVTAFDSMSLGYMLTMGSMYVVGALIYGWRIPERWWPGKFDYFGGSHQIFHCFVVGAAIVHYIGVVRVVRFWHEGNGAEYCGNA